MDRENIFAFFKKYYDLPVLEYKEEISENIFQCYKQQHYFITLTLFTPDKKTYLLKDHNKQIGWELPGTQLKSGEKIEDAIARIASTETGFAIDELKPLTFVNNVFTCNGKAITHRGIAFSGLSRRKISNDIENFTGVFVRNIPENLAFQNRKIIELLHHNLDEGFVEPPYEEIESVSTSFLINFIHKYIIRFIGSSSSRKIRKKLFSLIETNTNSILDAACGDSNLIFELEKKFKPEVTVGNDISWLSILKLDNEDNKVIFTNHNVVHLPFKTKFDTVIFRNTLHHIGPEEQVVVIRRLSSIAKRLIIIDIEDPQNTTLMAKLWNNYYVSFLDDQGDSFLLFDKFRKVVCKASPNSKLEFGRISTIKGEYMYSVVNTD